MQRHTVFVFLLCFLTFPLLAEEEPILIIDPHGHSSTISELMFTPDGQTLVSVSLDKTIRLWDVATGDLIKTLRGHIGEGYEGALMAAALSPDGNILAVGGFLGPQGGEPELIGHIRLFNLKSGEQIGVLAGHDNVVFGLDFSSDGKWLATGSGDRATAVWDISPILAQPGSEAQLIAVLGGSTNPGPPVYDVAFGPNKRTLVTTAYWRTLILHELKKNPVGVTGFDVLKSSYDMEGHRDQVLCVDFAPNGEYIVSGGKDGYVLLWDGTGKYIAELDQFQHPVGTVSFSADSAKIVASGTTGQDTHVYAIPSGEKLTSFTLHTDTVEASAFFGNTLIATAGGGDNDIYIWNADSGDVLTHITGKGKQPVALGFGSQLRLAIGTGNTAPRDVVIEVPQDVPEYTPLDTVFDVADMRFSQQLPREPEFTRIRTTYQGRRLERVSSAVLHIIDGATIEPIENHAHYDGMIRAYTYTPDGNIVVGSSYSLKLYDPDGYLIRDFVGHTGEIWAVSISEDGRLLASGSSDQTIKLWSLATGELLVTLFMATDREWVCWTPQGYYAASAGGEKYIGWQINQGRSKAAMYYPVSIFRDQFHRPELVKRTVAVGSFAQAFQEFQVRSEQPLERTAVTQILPPTLHWISPGPEPMTTETAIFHIQADIDSASPLTLVRILRNGRPVDGQDAAGRGLMMETPEQTVDSRIDREITLLPGRNDITIFSANKDTGATSDTRTIFYRSDEHLPDLYAITIGISEYAEHGISLAYADDDAKAISRVLQGQEGTLYRRIHLRELYDAQATHANILEALAWLQEQATQKDVALLFVAAHGTNEGEKYYLLPTDVDPNAIEATSVSWQELSKTLGNLPAKALVLLDTCHSGQLGQDVPLQSNRDNTEALRTLSSDEYGVVILAASTGDESSLERDDWGHGAFTKALLEALEEGLADYSRDTIVYLRELDLYLADRVEELTDGSQHPTTQKPSTISRFPIAHVTK